MWGWIRRRISSVLLFRNRNRIASSTSSATMTASTNVPVPLNADLGSEPFDGLTVLSPEITADEDALPCPATEAVTTILSPGRDEVRYSTCQVRASSSAIRV